MRRAQRKRNIRNDALRKTPLAQRRVLGVNRDVVPKEKPEKMDKPRGSRFAQARKMARLTLEDVSKHFEINRSTVLRWERGADPKKVDQEEIAGLYGVRVAWLMHGEGPMKGEAALAATHAHETQRSKSEPRLAVAQVEEILGRAGASKGESDAAWERLRSVKGDDPTDEWLRGWIDGFRTRERQRPGMIRPISSAPNRKR